MKYKLKSNGKEVKIGDTIAVTTTVETLFGDATATVHVTLTQDNISKLVEHDVIVEEEEKLNAAICIAKIASKLGITEEEVRNLMRGLMEADMYAPVLQMLLRAASEYLSPPIKIVKNMPKVYTISLIDGRVHEIQTVSIKSYDHFAYFVSKSQAKQVRTMLDDLFGAMYGK